MKRRVVDGFVLLAVLLVGCEVVSFDGFYEERRRLLVAPAMLEEGHWWVPHVLGEVYLKKPPGFNWMVALFSWVPGEVSRIPGRLVAVMSWLGTGALVGWMARDFDRRAARRTAVAAFLFAPVVFLEKVGLAELDLWLTFLLTAGVVGWFKLWRRGRPGAAWGLGHCLLALALLTKGPVAYLFFYLPIAGWLYGRSEPPRWGRLLGGVLLGHGLVALWAAAYFRVVDPGRFLAVVTGELGRSSTGGTWVNYFLHLLEYPLRILLAALPWGFIGFFAFDSITRRGLLKRVRRTPAGALIAAGFLPLLLFWIYPDDTVRYVLPVFPWMALAAGLIVDTVPETLFRRAAAVTLYALIVLYIVTLLVYPNVADVHTSGLSHPTIRSASYLLALGCLLMMAWLSLRDLDTRRFVEAGVIFMVLLKAAYVAVYLPVKEPGVLSNERTVRELIRDLPRVERKLRYNAGHHLEVPYYFRRYGYTVHGGRPGDAPARTGITIVARRRHFQGEPGGLRAFVLPDDQRMYVAVHGPSNVSPRKEP